MVPAVSAQGHLHLMVAERTVNAAVFVVYRKRRIHDYQQYPIFMIVDGRPTHQTKATTEWVESTGGRLELFFLPA